MYAVWSKQRKAYKTRDGWTQYVRDKNGERIEGLEDVLRFTEGEANSNKLPTGQVFIHFPGPVDWRDFK